MKTYSKVELIAMAIEVFANYPTQDKCFAREDGNIFFSENLADLDKGKLKVYPLDKIDLIDVQNAELATETNPATPVIPLIPSDYKKAVAKAAAKGTPKNVVKKPAPKVDQTLGKDGKSPEARNALTPNL